MASEDRGFIIDSDWKYRGDRDVTMGGTFYRLSWRDTLSYVEVVDVGRGEVQITLGSSLFTFDFEYDSVARRIVRIKVHDTIRTYQSVVDTCLDYPSPLAGWPNPSNVRRIWWWNVRRSMPRQERREDFLLACKNAGIYAEDRTEYVVFDVETWSNEYDANTEAYWQHRPHFVNDDKGLNYFLVNYCWGVEKDDDVQDVGLQEIDIWDDSVSEVRHAKVHRPDFDKYVDDTHLLCGADMYNLSYRGVISWYNATFPHVVTCEKCLDILTEA